MKAIEKDKPRENDMLNKYIKTYNIYIIVDFYLFLSKDKSAQGHPEVLAQLVKCQNC